MSTEVIIAICASGGAGAIISALLTYFLGKRTAKRDDFAQIIKTLQEDNIRLRERVDKMEGIIEERTKTIEKQARTIQDMEIRLAFSGEADKFLTLPMWRKDSRGIMRGLNEAYETLFLAPNGLSKLDYIGKDDIQFWGPDTGSRYQANDSLAMEMGYFAGVEHVKYDGGIDFGKWLVLKYRVISKVGGHEVLIGTKGICIPLKGIIE